MPPHPATHATSDDDSDAELVHAVVARKSEHAFRALYRRHNPRVYALVRRMIGSTADAEDVVQETWFRAVRKLGSFAGRSELRTWLTGIAVNVAREHLAIRGR